MPEGKFNIPAQIGVTVPHSNVDAYYGPYSSLDEAREASDVVKADGLTVAVADGTSLTEYWWVGGNLTKKLSTGDSYPKVYRWRPGIPPTNGTGRDTWIKVATVTNKNIDLQAGTLWFLFCKEWASNGSMDFSTLGCAYFGGRVSSSVNVRLDVMQQPELWRVKQTTTSGSFRNAEIWFNVGNANMDQHISMTVLSNSDLFDGHYEGSTWVRDGEHVKHVKEDATTWEVPDTISNADYASEPEGDGVYQANLFYSAPTFTAGANVQIANNVISATDTKYTAGTNVQISSDNVISGSGVTVTSSEHVGTSGGNSWHEYFIKQGDNTVGTFSTFSLGFTQTGKLFPVKTDSGAKLYVDLSGLSTGNTYTAGTNIQISGDNVISFTPTGEEGQLMYYSSTNGRWGATGAARRVDKMPTWGDSSEQSTVYGLSMSGLNVDGPSFFRGDISIASGDISSAGSMTATGFYESSDRRLKDDIEDAEIELEDIDKIPVVNFHYKSRDGWQLGTIAQDVQDLFPELVSEGKDGYLSVDYSKLACVAVAGVKKLKEENRTLQDKMLLMEQTTDILLRRIDMLEKRIK